ncbi:cytosine deaminase [Spirulina subsalsa FACHB-351]|uniref:Cytosine deaminase n=1 Tax=Spirulina subsalsa FACHB-351 TaxID=234711 RepID=A0ABT3LBF3_9CYAN|nr:cytosine deaminase [Spirulina subsalsa]MCW6038424.1 cytosine deaminase [Spirulina subsalsa FACHB-351]
MILSDFSHFWLNNAHCPPCFLPPEFGDFNTKWGFCQINLEIKQGKIQQILPATESGLLPDTIPQWELKKSIILPCFVDIHTHLDKGHISRRTPNLLGTFAEAVKIIREDCCEFWQEEDLYRRMEFGLKCSYAHGTQAIRTHLDVIDQQHNITFDVFKTLQKEWENRIILQPSSLFPVEHFLTEEGVKVADGVAQLGGILGAVVYPHQEVDRQLDRMLELAMERGLDVDFHVDETDDPQSQCLLKVAEAVLRHGFSGQVLCGHCCSLAVQSPAVVQRTIEAVQRAGIAVVSLPMCNLYLQGREGEKTPRWRGVTLVHELKAQGIPVLFASDNCRDPFFGFGDHDLLEVFNQSVRIAQLNPDYSDWIGSVTTIPAQVMGLEDLGCLKPGAGADLIIFRARYWDELLSRSQRDRIVLRQGRPIDTTLPDYEELDDLIVNR